MRRILVTGAGGSPATNFVRSLRAAPDSFHLIGADCNEYCLQRAETDEKYLIPTVDDPDYLPLLKSVISDTGAEMIYSQPDQEIMVISRHRDEIGVRTFLPAHKTIEICQDKYQSYLSWAKDGITVPKTMLINDESDLNEAFAKFGDTIWLRAIISPGGGKGSFRASNPRVAKAWMDFSEGWGNFTAAECLLPETIAWLSIWHEGELVVAQGRKRLYWEFGNRAPSGVTGITGTGLTVSDPATNEIAPRCIKAIDPKPHGIFAVDFTYDSQGIPNPTEINIGRFFTTHHFFTECGLNMPYIFVKLAFGEEPPPVAKKVNPLTSDLAWIRGMDIHPVLKPMREIELARQELRMRRERLGE
jgi:hypothetical protein